MSLAHLLQNSMIWTNDPTATDRQCYAVFRKTLKILQPVARAELRIFADSRYLLWMNGTYVENGPARFDPQRPEYDVLEVTSYLTPGENAVAVVVHAYAVGSFTRWSEQNARMIAHAPGLAAQLAITLTDGQTMSVITDTSWKVNCHTRYQPSPGCYSTVPDNIDARLDDGDWTVAAYDDAPWPYAINIAGNAWGAFQPRTLPLLRKTGSAPLADKLPLTLTGETTIDLGKTVQAYVELVFEAEAGVELTVGAARSCFAISPTENLFVPPHRYVARRGRQHYVTGDTFGVRLLTLHVNHGALILHDLKVVDRKYPLTRVGRFECADPQLNRLWAIALNTVELCAEDAFVDCADRERAQWLADVVIVEEPIMRVALAGPRADGSLDNHDHRLFRNMLRHVALSQLPDGRVQPMRPSSYPATATHGVIDDYACLWVHGLRTLSDRAGDEAFVRESWPRVVKLLDYFLGLRTERGLVKAQEFIIFGNPMAYKVCEGASINAYIHGALCDAAALGEIVGDAGAATRFSTAAAELYEAYNTHLWDAVTGSYFAAAEVRGPQPTPHYYHLPVSEGVQPPTGHAAVLALYYNMVPAERQQRTYAFMLRQFPHETPFTYTHHFLFEVLYRQQTASADQLVLETIRSKWQPMIASHDDVTWESFTGGSRMHNCGALPAYFLSAYVLGVRTEMRDKRLQLKIEPRLGDLTFAQGVVLTEFGAVTVSWQRAAAGTLLFNCTIPEGAQAALSLPRPISAPNVSLIVNDQILVERRILHGGIACEGRYFTLMLPAGAYRGILRSEG